MSKLQNVQKKDTPKSNKILIVFRAVVFTIGFASIFHGLNYLFQPIWVEWNNYDTIHGFYEQPENTIETIFLGSSYCVNGITPMELYEEYGMCAYNLGTEQQPVLVSYYWLEEASRLHSESLTTVVLDVSMMKGIPDESFYRKGIDGMRLSSVKWRAAMAYTADLYEGLSSLVPLISYHERWTELTETGFDIGRYETNDSVRGYNFETSISYFSGRSYDSLHIPSYYPEYGEEEAALEEEALYYLKQIIGFCDENDLDLVLIRTPVVTAWSVPLHNAVETIADRYALEFLDFNYNPLFDEIAYNPASDSSDGNHMNYYGARKLTVWLGAYLTEEYRITDVRNMNGYEFLDEKLEQYCSKVKRIVTLNEITDPAEYLSSAVSNDNYTVFIMVKDDASNSLTEEQRQRFASLGLSELASIGYRDSYLAVINGGIVDYEILDPNPPVQEEEENIKNDLENITEEDIKSQRAQKTEEQFIFYKGILADGTEYVLKSGGLDLGNISSCVIDGEEYAPDSRGLNIIIYDNSQKEVIDISCFDTFDTAVRASSNLEAALEADLENINNYTELSPDLQKFYLYNVMCEDARKVSYQKRVAGDSEKLTYLSGFLNDENYAIFISVKDQDGYGIREDVAAVLSERGLAPLSEQEYIEAYLAVIAGGEAIGEYMKQGEDSISISNSLSKIFPPSRSIYMLKSEGTGAENISSITVNDKEYLFDSNGINIIIWNMITNIEVDIISFDIHADEEVGAED